MILKVKLTEKLSGTITLPASKSYSIRAFIIAACGGASKIIHPSNSEDGKVAISAAKVLGAQVKPIANNSFIVKASVKKSLPARIDVHESGTVLRFLLPLVSLSIQKTMIVGKKTLRGRPNLFLTKTLRSMNVNIRGTGKGESIPVRKTGGQLRGGNISIDGSLSSQFISALLIACPQLEENTQLKLTGKKLVSTDYITMTRQILSKAGIKIDSKGSRYLKIKGGQKFKGLKNFAVPSDYGLAAFTMAAAALVPSNVTLKGNLNDRLVQADGHIIALLKKMGVVFMKTSKFIKVKGAFSLNGGQFSLKDCPDLVPIMAVLAMFAKGKTRLYNIAHARAKESDRISDLRNELIKVGADIEETADELVITPCSIYKNNVTLNPHGDHRLAMAFSVLGLKLGVNVRDIECCAKSYPDFVNDFIALGARISRSKI